MKSSGFAINTNWSRVWNIEQSASSIGNKYTQQYRLIEVMSVTRSLFTLYSRFTVEMHLNTQLHSYASHLAAALYYNYGSFVNTSLLDTCNALEDDVQDFEPLKRCI